MAEEREQAQRDTSHIPAGRVEERFERAGESMGVFAAQAGQRLQSLLARGAQAVQDAANRSAQAGSAARHPNGGGQTTKGGSEGGSEGAQAETAGPTEGAAATEARAEELVDAFGQRLSAWSHVADLRLRTLWARIKEEGEDILAEARDVRRRDTTSPS